MINIKCHTEITEITERDLNKNQENPFARQTLFRAQSTISDKSAGKQAFRHPSPQCCYHLRWLLSLKGKTPFTSFSKKPSFIWLESKGRKTKKIVICRMSYHNVIEGIWTADDESLFSISDEQRTSKRAKLSHSQIFLW